MLAVADGQPVFVAQGHMEQHLIAAFGLKIDVGKGADVEVDL